MAECPHKNDFARVGPDASRSYGSCLEFRSPMPTCYTCDCYTACGYPHAGIGGMRNLSITGEVPFDGPVDPSALQAHLVDNLREVHAKDIRIENRRIGFTGGYFRLVTTWNLLVPFGFGSLTVDSERRQVSYSLSYRQQAISNALIILLLEILFAALNTSTPLTTTLGLPLVVLFASLLNVVRGRARFERFLRRAITSCPLPIVKC